MSNGKKIIMAGPMAFDSAKSFFSSSKLGLSIGRFADDLRKIFAGKSSSTLHGRASPLLRYMVYCKSVNFEAFPLSEEVVYAYMVDEESKSSPTYLRSFMNSLGFALRVLGLQSARTTVLSPRVKGVAVKCYLNK